MSLVNEGFRKNRQPEVVPEPEPTKLYQDKSFIGLLALIGGTIILTTGIAVAFGLPFGAIVFGSILLAVGFILGFNKDN